MSLLRNLLLFLATAGLVIGFYWGNWRPEWKDGIVGFLIQAASLLGVICLARTNKKREWHRKYMDYRVVAENFRWAGYLHPLGLGRLEMALHPYQGGSPSWVNVHLRSVLRMAGLPNTSLANCQQQYLRDLAEGIEGQRDFHQKNAHRYEKAWRKIETLTETLFLSGIFLILLRVTFHFIYVNYPHNDLKRLKSLFNCLALFVPASGAFTNSLQSHLGFEKLKERSRVMANVFHDMTLHLDQLLAHQGEGKRVTYEDLQSLADKVRTVFLEEVADWRVFISSKAIAEK